MFKTFVSDCLQNYTILSIFTEQIIYEMKNLLITLGTAAILAVSLTSCSVSKNLRQTDNQIGIVAHRGFWNCEEAGYAQNSVAALKAAQDAGFWGSEFDVQLTSDFVVVSNHDKEYGPEKWIIADHTYEQLCKYPLPNGEKLPTLADYLRQGKQSDKTVLVLEIKTQRSDELTNTLVDKTMEVIKEEGLYDPSRIVFISFSELACLRIAQMHPDFEVQYLNGDMDAEELQENNLEGADYHYAFYHLNKKFVKQLHERNLKSNVWTVDKEKEMKYLFNLGIDQITTNEPLKAREILSEREFTL